MKRNCISDTKRNLRTMPQYSTDGDNNGCVFSETWQETHQMQDERDCCVNVKDSWTEWHEH